MSPLLPSWLVIKMWVAIDALISGVWLNMVIINMRWGYNNTWVNCNFSLSRAAGKMIENSSKQSRWTQNIELLFINASHLQYVIGCQHMHMEVESGYHHMHAISWEVKNPVNFRKLQMWCKDWLLYGGSNQLKWK